MSPQRRAWVLLVAGSLLFLASVAVLVLPGSDADFGWFAYAPLPDDVDEQGYLFIEPPQLWAAPLAMVCLVVAGWGAGFLAGRRSGSGRS